MDCDTCLKMREILSDEIDDMEFLEFAIENFREMMGYRQIKHKTMTSSFYTCCYTRNYGYLYFFKKNISSVFKNWLKEKIY